MIQQDKVMHPYIDCASRPEWNDPERLLQAFRWSETPQGHDYWESRFWQMLAEGGTSPGRTELPAQWPTPVHAP